MEEAFKNIKQGLQEASAHAQGAANACDLVCCPQSMAVKTLRRRVAMTQGRFIARLWLSVAVLRGWKGGDRAPHGPALVQLNGIVLPA